MCKEMNIVMLNCHDKCGHNDKSREVTYVDAYHGISLDKKDILSSQLEACEKKL
jgi:hypothetical protein